jgi:cell division protein FtsB
VRYRKRNRELEINLLTTSFLKPIIIIIGVSIFLYLYISNTIAKYFFLKKQYEKLKNQVGQIKQENIKLEKEIYLLQTDTDTIEYYIRKELNYKKPNEKVLIIK